jgi:Type IV secretory pathway, VirB4 components
MCKPQCHPLASLYSPELAQHILDNCSMVITLSQSARPFCLPDDAQEGHTVVVGRTGSGKSDLCTLVMNDVLRRSGDGRTDE